MSVILPIDLPRLARLDGPCQLALCGEAPVQLALRTLAREALGPWIELGALGAYTAGSAQPAAVSLAEGASIKAFGDGDDLMLETRSLDPRAFQVLRSMLLCQLARRVLDRAGKAPVEEERRESELAHAVGDARLVVSLLDSVETERVRLPVAGVDPDESGFDLYPAPCVRDAFELIVAPQPGKLRRCVVTFMARVDVPLLSALDRVVRPWAAVLEMGGFEQPTPAPGTHLPAFGVVQIFERDSAEIVVDHFDAAESAWGVLANVLATLAAAHPITAVELH